MDFSNFIFFSVTVPISFQLSLPKISDILLLSSSLNENNILVGSSPKRALAHESGTDIFLSAPKLFFSQHKTIEVINPSDESVIGSIAAGTKEDIDLAVGAAKEAFKTFGFSSKEERIELIENIITEYEKR